MSSDMITMMFGRAALAAMPEGAASIASAAKERRDRKGSAMGESVGLLCRLVLRGDIPRRSIGPEAVGLAETSWFLKNREPIALFANPCIQFAAHARQLLAARRI